MLWSLLSAQRRPSSASARGIIARVRLSPYSSITSSCLDSFGADMVMRGPSLHIHLRCLPTRHAPLRPRVLASGRSAHSRERESGGPHRHTRVERTSTRALGAPLLRAGGFTRNDTLEAAASGDLIVIYFECASLPHGLANSSLRVDLDVHSPIYRRASRRYSLRAVPPVDVLPCGKYHPAGVYRFCRCY